MRLLLLSFTLLLSTTAFAKCDISDQPTTATKYKFVLNANTSMPYSKYIKVNDRKNLGKDVLNCMSEVDIAFEMGDGYYDVRSSKLVAIFYPNSTRIAGYVEEYKLYYTEDREIVEAEVRYNSKGQRISAPMY